MRIWCPELYAPEDVTFPWRTDVRRSVPELEEENTGPGAVTVLRMRVPRNARPGGNVQGPPT